MLDLLPHDPSSHGIDVEPLHVATDAVGLEKRGTTAHEGICHRAPGKSFASKKSPPADVAEFRKDQASEQRAGPTREPLVNCDNRPVVLLDLFLLECHGGNQGNVETGLDAHVQATDGCFWAVGDELRPYGELLSLCLGLESSTAPSATASRPASSGTTIRRGSRRRPAPASRPSTAAIPGCAGRCARSGRSRARDRIRRAVSMNMKSCRPCIQISIRRIPIALSPRSTSGQTLR